MVEANPWWKNLPADRELPDSYGCVGVKPDGGGSMAGRGRVGPMRLHRACNNRDLKALQAALEQGDDPNEVEAVRLRARPTSPVASRAASTPRVRCTGRARSSMPTSWMTYVCHREAARFLVHTPPRLLAPHSLW